MGGARGPLLVLHVVTALLQDVLQCLALEHPLSSHTDCNKHTTAGRQLATSTKSARPPLLHPSSTRAAPSALRQAGGVKTLPQALTQNVSSHHLPWPLASARLRVWLRAHNTKKTSQLSAAPLVVCACMCMMSTLQKKTPRA